MIKCINKHGECDGDGYFTSDECIAEALTVFVCTAGDITGSSNSTTWTDTGL